MNDQYITINDNSTININVNDYDVWSLVVLHGNFMLDKYKGRGKTIIKVIGFTNLGDGITGEIEFFVNNKRCFKGGIAEPEGENCKFSVSPRYVSLGGNGTTEQVTVSLTNCDNCGWTYEVDSEDLFTVTETQNGLSIKSKTNDSFENIKITLTNCDGAKDYVYVSQDSYANTCMLLVNPQYINLNDDNKTFTVSVTSLDKKGDKNYTVEGDINVTKTANSFSGEIENEGVYKLTVKNDCDLSEEVTINYTKQSESEHYLWINTIGTSSVEQSFTSNTAQEYDILSSSTWKIKSYDSDYLSCSKIGNKINVSLSPTYNGEFSNKIITLVNNEGDIAKIVCSSSVKVEEDGIVFEFCDDTTVYNVTLEEATNENLSFTACVKSYLSSSNNNLIKWKNKSSSFKIGNGTTAEQTVNPTASSTTVTFNATTATKNTTLTAYTITLQEQDSFNEIKILVKINRQAETNAECYKVSISPESGNYEYANMAGFQVTVIPTYVFNGFEYYLGDNHIGVKDTTDPNDRYIEGYKGVTAITEIKYNGSTVSSYTSDDSYDGIIYTLNNITSEITSITVSTTAQTSSSGEVTTACNDSVTASTEYKISPPNIVKPNCEFYTDAESIEVGYEATAETYTLISQMDGECVEWTPTITYNGSSSDWLTVDSTDCDNVIYNFQENDGFDDRTATVVFTQDNSGGCSGTPITVNIIQYGNGTIFIPNFDYLVVRYFWTADDGDDLDTVTVVSYLEKKDGSQITASTDVYEYIDKGVGFAQGVISPNVPNDNGEKDNRVISGTNENGEAIIYIAHAGDNTDDGNECVYMNFYNLCSEDQLRKMLEDGIEKIHVDLYGIWYASKGEGNLDVSLIAYREGTMIDDPNDQYNFKNSGGTEVYNDVKAAKVCASGGGKASTYKTDYTHIGYVEYNIKTQGAMLSLNEQCVESTYSLYTGNSLTQNISSDASSTNYILFNSKKDDVYFSSVTVSVGDCTWISNPTTTSTTNPIKYTYTVAKNDTGDERSCNIIVTQAESGKKLTYTITQTDMCICTAQTVVNVDSAVLSVGEYEVDATNGGYKFPVTCEVTLSHVIECGSATATIYFNTTDNGNAASITVDIEEGNNYGVNTMYYSVSTNQYPNTNCIYEVGSGHDIIFTDTDCYSKGVINVSIGEGSMCTECTCEVTNITINGVSGESSYTFTSETETKNFIMKTTTSACAACTKKSRFTDPNGTDVGVDTDEYTISISNGSVINGKYTLTSDDNTSKKAYITLTKYFEPYCVFEIARVDNGVTGTYGTTIVEEYEADDSSDHYFTFSCRSKYYTAETSSSNVNVDMVSNADWVVVNNTNKTFEVLDNTSTNSRSATITLTQQTPCSGICYLVINQKGVEVTNETTSALTLNTTATTFDVTFYSCYGTDYDIGSGVSYTIDSTGCTRVDDAVSSNNCEMTERFSVGNNNSGTIKFYQETSGKELSLTWSKENISKVTKITITSNVPGNADYEVHLASAFDTSGNIGAYGSHDFDISTNTRTSIYLKNTKEAILNESNQLCSSCHFTISIEGENISFTTEIENGSVIFSNNSPEETKVIPNSSDGMNASMDIINGDYLVEIIFQP